MIDDFVSILNTNFFLISNKLLNMKQCAADDMTKCIANNRETVHY